MSEERGQGRLARSGGLETEAGALPPAQERAALRPGDVVAGRYRVLRLLGSGGMGRSTRRATSSA